MILICYMNKSKKIQNYINRIEKIRSKNNVNWMDILRLAFKYAPREASKIMRRINSDDRKISSLLKKIK